VTQNTTTPKEKNMIKHTNTQTRSLNGYPVTMDNTRPAAVRTQYQARPGRRAIVVTELASLRGPAHGTVVLPLRLFWSPSGRRWDLDDPPILREMYATVLQEAVSPEELTTYLNADLLVTVWRDLFLPRGVRRAWEEHHPVLRETAAAGAVA
jgi:hypothetical protein